MKNTINIITTLGIVTSFPPLYSMELKRTPSYWAETNRLKDKNPLSDMSNIHIYRDKFSVLHNTNLDPITGNNLLSAKEGLPLKLTVIKFFIDPDSEKNKQTLGQSVLLLV